MITLSYIIILSIVLSSVHTTPDVAAEKAHVSSEAGNGYMYYASKLVKNRLIINKSDRP